MNVTSLGSPALTNLTLRGYPQTAHPQESAYNGFGGGTQILDRYFSVTPNSGAAGYTVNLCLNYDDAEVTAAGATEATLILCRWTGTAWSCKGRGTGTSTTNNLVCADGVTALSDWVLAQGSPLAVDLAVFSVEATAAGVVLTWETISEVGNAGFNVHRAASDTGPWTQINSALIPAAAPGSSEGHAYTWIDATVTPGATYWYALEDVALDGTVTRHAPVMVALAEPNAVGLAAFSATAAAPALAGCVATTLVVAALAGARSRRRRCN